MHLSTLAAEKPCGDMMCDNGVQMWNDTCVCEVEDTGAAGKSTHCLYISVVVETCVSVP